MPVASIGLFLVGPLADALVLNYVFEVLGLLYFFKILNLGAFHFKYSAINYYIVPLLMFTYT